MPGSATRTGTAHPSVSRFSGAGNLLASSAVWGAYPPLIALAVVSVSPFGFLAAWCAGGFIGTALFVVAADRSHVRRWLSDLRPPQNGGFWRPLADTAQDARWNWQMWAAAGRIAVFEVTVAWSARHVSEVVLAVVFQTWAVFYLLSLNAFFRGDRKNYNHDNTTTAMFVVVFLGVALTIFSQQETSAFGTVSVGDFVAVSMLLLASVLYAGGDSVAVRWVYNMEPPKERTERFELAAVMWSRLPAYAVGAVIGLTGMVVLDMGYPLDDFLLVAVGGAVLGAVGHSLNMAGTLRCRSNPGVLCFRYLTPVFSMGYLWVLTDREEHVHWGLWTAGLALILACGAVAALRSDKKHLGQEQIGHPA